MHYQRNVLFVVVTSTLSDNDVQRAPSKVLSFHMSNVSDSYIFFFPQRASTSPRILQRVTLMATVSVNYPGLKNRVT